jgi:hypothetical protein
MAVGTQTVYPEKGVATLQKVYHKSLRMSLRFTKMRAVAQWAVGKAPTPQGSFVHLSQDALKRKVSSLESAFHQAMKKPNCRGQPFQNKPA